MYKRQALGRAGYIRTEKDYAYLIQRCKDGFVLREFWAERTYWKDSLPSDVYKRQLLGAAPYAIAYLIKSCKDGIRDARE